MMGDPVEEFPTSSERGGRIDLPSPRRHDTGDSLAPVTTTPWLKDILDITTAQQARYIIMGADCSGPPSPLQTMMGDSAEEFPTASDREGRINLPSPTRHDTGASLAPVTTTPWLKDILTSPHHNRPSALGTFHQTS
jgi:hypothetical protein